MTGKHGESNDKENDAENSLFSWIGGPPLDVKDRPTSAYKEDYPAFVSSNNNQWSLFVTNIEIFGDDRHVALQRGIILRE